MLTRLARWWLGRTERNARDRAPSRPAGECTQVGCPDPATHVIVALADDDAKLGIEAGGRTAMSADYCPGHCPGGCLQGCATLEA